MDRELEVGDFVRLERVKLFAPSYAVLYYKASYAESFGSTPEIRYDPFLKLDLKAIRPFRKRVGKNPRLPFVAPFPAGSVDDAEAIRVILPTRYAGLSGEPSLLSGNVTVLGKVVHKDFSGPNADPYIDFQTVRRVGPALDEAPPVLLELLGFGDEAVLAQNRGDPVRAFDRFRPRS